MKIRFAPARLCGFCCRWLILLSPFAAAPGLSATLLRDINATGPALGSYVPPVTHAVIGSLTLFVMDDGSHGAELWRTDGSSQGTYLLKDIQPGLESSDIVGLTELNGAVVFYANDGTNGKELWISDGTPAGTHIVANIDQTASDSTYWNRQSIPKLGDSVIFAATDKDQNLGLWRSDGTSAGTWRVKGLNWEPRFRRPENFAALGTHVFFTATTAGEGTELWVTDGTTDGTHLVKDIAPGAASSDPRELTATGTRLFFAANDGVNGPELWYADADGISAHLVADMVPGVNGVAPSQIISLGDIVIFNGVDSPGSSNLFPLNRGEPYRSDGTAAGTYRLRDIFPGPHGAVMDAAVRIGNRLVFHIQNVPSPGSAIWSTDGTADGTVPLFSSEFQGDRFTIFGQSLLFYARAGAAGSETAIWKTDGTPNGTTIFARLPQPFGGGGGFATIGARAYFSASACCVSGEWPNELWSSDGTESGTVQLADINPGEAGSSPQSFFVSNGKLYFLANDGVHGHELWVSDGTASGTQLLGDFNRRVSTPGSNPEPLGVVGGRAIYAADDGLHGKELWATDGTTQGTQLLRDIAPGKNGSNPGSPFARLKLQPVGGALLFEADDGVNGRELWRTDGTPAGTYLLMDVFPGLEPPRQCNPVARLYCPPADPKPGSSTPFGTLFEPLELNGFVYFAANDGIHGTELWRSDGTAAGTMLVADLTPGAQSGHMTSLGVARGHIYFCPNTGPGSYLWSSDGTAAGTKQVSSAVGCDSLRSGVESQGILYFPGLDTANDIELWRTDGTDPGTYRVIDLTPGVYSSDPRQLRSVGGRITFDANVYGQGRRGFYVSDGTSGGTMQVPGVSSPTAMSTNINGRIYLNSGIEGNGSWRTYVSDGTVAGTYEFLSPGVFAKGVHASSMTEYLGELVFTADDGRVGSAVWASDGTASGTRLLFDSYPASTYDAVFDYLVLGGSLVFSAVDGSHGTELWALNSGAPSTNPDVVHAAFNTSVRVEVLSNDGFVSSALDQSSVFVTAAPVHGAVSVDMSTGDVIYVPNSSFSGMDEFTYIVRDINSRVSNPATVRIFIASPLGSDPGVAPASGTSPAEPPSTPSRNSGPEPPSTPSSNSSSGGGGGAGSLVAILVLGVVASVRRKSRLLI